MTVLEFLYPFSATLHDTPKSRNESSDIQDRPVRTNNPSAGSTRPGSQKPTHNSSHPSKASPSERITMPESLSIASPSAVAEPALDPTQHGACGNQHPAYRARFLGRCRLWRNALSRLRPSPNLAYRDRPALRVPVRFTGKNLVSGASVVRHTDSHIIEGGLSAFDLFQNVGCLGGPDEGLWLVVVACRCSPRWP